MADESQLSPFTFPLQGGLVLDQSPFSMQPGMALELENFEPSVTGGYRRINGFSKYVTAIVPQTSASTEDVLMVTSFAGKVMAARGEKIFSADVGGSSWTERDNSRSNAKRYTFEKFNFDGNDKIIVADQANAPTVFNTSFAATDVTSAGGGEVTTAVTGAKFVAAFKDHMFYAGMSSTPQEIVFSEPFDEDDFDTSDGAGSIKVDDDITGLKVFRDALFIFCESRIFQLTGTSSSNFAITPITRNIGCVNGFTIQEFAGDLIFLSKDGLRTVAATARIGDVELGTISRPVQSLFSSETDVDEFVSLVIPEKTQYRIFFANSDLTEANTKGIICVRKDSGYEFSELKGIQPNCTDTSIVSGDSVILHGGFNANSYVFRQEQGSQFDSTTIIGKYRSPDLTMGDAGIRKNFQRAIINYSPEGALNTDLFLRYDYDSPNVANPAAYPFDSSNVVAIYGSATYNTSTYGGQSTPLTRQPIEGSGFALALKIVDNAVSLPYALKGFQLEFDVGARR